jgi:fructose-bisphosphate aldolase class 1
MQKMTKLLLISYPLGIRLVVVLVGGQSSQQIELYLVDSNGRLPCILLQYSLVLTFNLHVHVKANSR